MHTHAHMHTHTHMHTCTHTHTHARTHMHTHSHTQLYGLELPNHWLRDFFFAEASLELLLTEDALSYYTNLSLVGFASSSYITAQLALVNYHLKGKSLVSYASTIHRHCEGRRTVVWV